MRFGPSHELKPADRLKEKVETKKFETCVRLEQSRCKKMGLGSKRRGSYAQKGGSPACAMSLGISSLVLGRHFYPTLLQSGKHFTAVTFASRLTPLQAGCTPGDRQADL